MTGPVFRYLTGVDNSHTRQLADTHHVGLMLQPGSYRPSRSADYPVHAVDNGCFTPPGQPDRFNEAKWLRYLDRVPREGCLFAVVPDVPFDWVASWRRSARYVEQVRGMGFKVAIAMQNGATAATVPWDDIDVVFIGGDTSWKLGIQSLEIAHEAHHRGKPVHMGRANSQRRFRRAIEMLVDTADGTFAKHGPPELMADRLRAMLNPIYASGGHQLACA